jgi:sterol 14-demethylase
MTTATTATTTYSAATAPPMLRGLPLLGHAVEFQRNRAALFARGLREIGPIFGIRLFTRPAAVLIGPEHHRVFFDETDKRLRMDKPYAFLRAVLGDVGFLASPEVYKAQRAILHSPFKAARVPAQLAIMHAETRRFLDALPSSGELELTSAVTEIVQDVAAHAMMGRAARDQLGREFFEQFAIVGRALDPMLPPNLPLPKFIRRDIAKRKLRRMVAPMIAERRAHPDRHDDFLADFVRARLADGTALTDDQLQSLVLALVFAGHETTAGQAAWTIIQVLQHPEYAARLRAEVDAKLAPRAAIDAAKLGELAHVRWGVMETTRMRPSADLLIRSVEEDFPVGGFVVPKGWMALVTGDVAQRLPELFQEPDRYDPLRFSPERREDAKDRFGIIGFGGGVHKCAGMNFANAEMAIIAAMIFRELDLELVTKSPRVVRGLGASRPSPVRVRYRKR